MAWVHIHAFLLLTLLSNEIIHTPLYFCVWKCSFAKCKQCAILFHPFFTSKNIPGAQKEGHPESFHPGESLPIETLSRLLSFTLNSPPSSSTLPIVWQPARPGANQAYQTAHRSQRQPKKDPKSAQWTPLDHLAVVLRGESAAGTTGHLQRPLIQSQET